MGRRGDWTEGGPRFWLGVFVVCVAIVAAVWVVTSLFDRSDERERIEALREELRESRAVVDSCRQSVSREEMAFQEYDRRVDSLRGLVDRYESMAPGGVPADSYPLYMEAFESYNRAVPDWAARADTLQAHWRACRETIREHNVVADSLRRLLETLSAEERQGRRDVSEGAARVVGGPNTMPPWDPGGGDASGTTHAGGGDETMPFPEPV